MLQNIFQLLFISLGILILSVGIYLAIRYFAYKRNFPLPHRYDVLWALNTILFLFLTYSFFPPLDTVISPSSFNWLSFATFLLSSYLLIFVVDQFLVEYFLINVLKINIAPPLRKVGILALLLVAVLVAVQKIFNITPWKVWAPTGIILPAIGFALKDIFQTFFSGVALCKIIRLGDWIQVGEREGEVLDINWARTVIRSWDGVHYFIPNRELQTAIFQSFSYKNHATRCQIQIAASYASPPQKVKKILLECVRETAGVLPEPQPEVLLIAYSDFSIQYALTFWIEDYSHKREICSDVSTRIWYAFKREKIEIPFPIRTVHLLKKQREEEKPIEFGSLFAQIDLFKALSQKEQDFILHRLQKQTYLQGEIIVREGDTGSSFYILLRGHLEVLVLAQGENQKPQRIGELLPGQFFGELSLLTGAPRSATVRAVTDSELLRLEKEDLQELLENNPNLADSLATAVVARQSLLSQLKESEKETASVALEKKNGLSQKIRIFFNLKEKV